MSATEAAVTKPEETKAMAEAPAVAQVEAAVVPDAMPAVDATPAEAKPADADAMPADADAMPADADAKPDAADAKPADAMPATDAMTETKPEHKNRGLFGKLLSLAPSFKSKSPKKEKKDKKEDKKGEPEVMPEETPMATPAAEAATNAEVPKAAEVTMVTDSAQAAIPVAAVTEEVKEAPKEAPMEAAKETPMEAAKEMSLPKEAKATKLQRRLSQVADIFRSKPKLDLPTSPKVDEHPPKIEQPKLVEPLENPASDRARVPEAVEVATPAMVTPPVAATA